jgi:hypothetical protein
MLHRIGELLVQVLGKGRTWVVGEDPDEHDGIVLHMGARVVVFGQELADLGSCRLRCGGARDGGLDDGGQVEDFFSL